MLTLVRYMWAAPTTVLGLLLLPAGIWRGHALVVDGVLEVHGPLLAWLLTHATTVPVGASAITLGHVVLGRDRRALDSTRAHERVHVRQCERWGPLFVPAYLLASLWAALRGRHPYLQNRFEVEAYRADLAAFEPDAGMTGSVTDEGMVGLLTMVTRGAVAGVAGDELSAKNRVRRIRCPAWKM